jgi:hypothetical protein
VNVDFDWPTQLRHKRGAPSRLGGIDVFYDFDWAEFFRDGRMQFRNGKCLAQQAFQDCPTEKTAALLLTSRNDVEEGSFESPSLFVLVINFPRYLRLANADAAVSYLASAFAPGVTNLGQFNELTGRTPDEIRGFFERQLTVARVAGWADGNAERIEALRQIVGDASEAQAAPIPVALEAIRGLERLDAECVEALAELVGQDMNRDQRLGLLQALTDNPEGRRDASLVMGNRASERLEDARLAIEEYTALLEDPASNETHFQNFIEAKLWLLGLDYLQMRPRFDVPRGTLDSFWSASTGFTTSLS